MAILADTGFLLALIDSDDPDHAEAARLAAQSRETFIAPFAVVPEVCYFAQKNMGAAAERAFVESLARGEPALDWGDPKDLRRAAEILEKRPEFGFVDAAVMATAERLRIKKIATLDRRHFGGFKPVHCEAFELLP
jgi:predicted nucleic acid-binding protein